MAKRTIEAQKQSTALQSGKVDDLALNQSQEAETVKKNAKENTVKVNSKGNKSRSQIKEEQRKKLAQAREKEKN